MARTLSAWHLQRATELLGLLFAGGAAADKLIEGYFREHRQLGANDRRILAETVYACLRQRRFLEHVVADQAPKIPLLIAAYLMTSQGYSARALAELRVPGDLSALSARVRTVDATALPLAVRGNLPDWLGERLAAHFGETETLTLATALNEAAPVDVRVNTLKATREAVQQRLMEEGFACEPTPYSPIGLRRRERAPLFATDSFKSGLFEIQDEGSQVLSLLLEARRHERVADFCAGGGGKTLHLAALMANTGTIYAFDVAPKRLAQLKPRLARAGVHNVRTQVIANENDARIRRLDGKLDRVLVDAPCSGTGTVRRNPDIKWRAVDLPALVAQQQRIIEAAARLVKPGGRLVYATCSLLPEENEQVVAWFQSRTPEFTIRPVAAILARRQVPLAGMDPFLRLFPHRHHTDGFFAAVLERAAETKSPA